MHLTMNRFRVKPGGEAVWTGRDSHLPQVRGLAGFHLFRRAVRDGCRLCASHTLWHGEADFLAWTRSDPFRAAHKGAGDRRALYLGPPEPEVFESLPEIVPQGRGHPASQR